MRFDKAATDLAIRPTNASSSPPWRSHVYTCMRIYMAGKPELPNIGLHTVTQLLAVVVCINKSSTPRNYNPIRICSSGWLTTKEVASGRGDCDQLMTVIPSEQLTNLWKHEFVSSALLVQTSHATPSCEETPLSYKVHVEERVHSGDEQLFARSKP